MRFSFEYEHKCALNPLSPQKYVALRKVMITAEYQRMLLLLREEEQLHLDALEREAKDICEQLEESVQNDSVQRKSERIVQTADRDVPQAGHGATPGERGGPSSGRETLF